MARGLRRTALTGLALGLLAAGAAQAQAHTYEPTRLDDPDPGECKPHDCSLREALIATAGSFNTQRIVLKAGTYELEQAYDGDPATSGDFDVTGAVRLEGAGRGKTLIDGNGIDRVLAVTSGSSFIGNATIEDLTITGGDAAATGTGHGPDGGGVYAGQNTSLALRDAAIKGNLGDLGGGLELAGTEADIKRSVISGNEAAEGGGVHLRAVDDTFGEAKIASSTISGNIASKGGGVLADGSAVFGDTPPGATLVNSTVAKNKAAQEAGGIFADNLAQVSLSHVTVGYNKADRDNTAGGYGGGVVQHSSATVQVNESIVASNTVGTSGTDPECAGSFFGDGSVYMVPTGCTFDANTNLSVGSGGLSKFGDHGGPTPTISLKPSSAALGFSDDCPKRDQRGEPRSTPCDSGAYERPGSP